MLKSAVLARAILRFSPGGRVGIEREGRPGRWPAHEEADRVLFPVGAAALAAPALSATAWRAFAATIESGARALAASDEEATADLRLDGFAGRGGIVLVDPDPDAPADLALELVATRGRPRVRPARRSASGGGGSLALAAMALVIDAQTRLSTSGQLALALALEGLLVWFQDADRRGPSRDALIFAVEHADGRLSDLGRLAPLGLTSV